MTVRAAVSASFHHRRPRLHCRPAFSFATVIHTAGPSSAPTSSAKDASTAPVSLPLPRPRHLYQCTRHLPRLRAGRIAPSALMTGAGSANGATAVGVMPATRRRRRWARVALPATGPSSRQSLHQTPPRQAEEGLTLTVSAAPPTTCPTASLARSMREAARPSPSHSPRRRRPARRRSAYSVRMSSTTTWRATVWCATSIPMHTATSASTMTTGQRRSFVSGHALPTE